MAHLDLFISQSPTDDAYSTALARTLRTAGVWVSHELSVLENGHLPQATEAKLRHCPAFLVILSPAALATAEVREACAWAAFQARRDPTRLLLSVTAVAINDSNDATDWPFAHDFTRIEGERQEPLP